jgi:hypothetical protein
VGKCTLGDGTTLDVVCETCGQAFSAQTEERLGDVMNKHYELNEGCRPVVKGAE